MITGECGVVQVPIAFRSTSNFFGGGVRVYGVVKVVQGWWGEIYRRSYSLGVTSNLDL
jgi:hypothetical protein